MTDFNYFESAQRLTRAAEALQKALSHPQAADHLYGLAAECCLSAVLVGARQSKYALKGDHPFADWEASHRYRSNIWLNQNNQALAAHRSAAEDCRNIMLQAYADGVFR